MIKMSGSVSVLESFEALKSCEYDSSILLYTLERVPV
jgi:hypothetical protein